MDLGGPLIGGAAVAVVHAIAHLIRRKGEASATVDEANAKAVVELVVQLGELRKDLERETAARLKLEERVLALQGQLDETESRARHYESQVRILSAQLESEGKARKSFEALYHDTLSELRELRRALTSGHTSSITLPPPRNVVDDGG